MQTDDAVIEALSAEVLALRSEVTRLHLRLDAERVVRDCVEARCRALGVRLADAGLGPYPPGYERLQREIGCDSRA